MQFSSFDLSTPVLRAITEAGYETPTPVQDEAIPVILEGRDILAGAQTGSGKTAAFALPIIERLSASRPTSGSRRPRALVLSPTRELATQIGDCFRDYGRHTQLRGTVIFGGVGQRPQEVALRRGVDIIVATPGRFLDLLNQGLLDLGGVECFVLDEADRLLDMGFINDIRKISGALPKRRQTLLFSATMPQSIRKLARELLLNPAEVAVDPVSSAAPLIDQYVHHVPKESKSDLLEAMLRENDIRCALVFTRTKHGADRVAKKLSRAGVSADAIHGNKSQNQRQRALAALKSGRNRVLVATDVAARGIDVSDITHVFNFDLPDEPESYVHRIGRTGRAGAKGIAIALCSKGERPLLKAIERLTGKRVTPLEGALVTGQPADHPAAPAPEGRPHAHDHKKTTPKRKPRGDMSERVHRTEIGLESRAGGPGRKPAKRGASKNQGPKQGRPSGKPQQRSAKGPNARRSKAGARR